MTMCCGCWRCGCFFLPVDVSQDGKTCLHVAVWKGNAEVVRELVAAGINVNVPDVVSVLPVDNNCVNCVVLCLLALCLL